MMYLESSTRIGLDSAFVRQVRSVTRRENTPEEHIRIVLEGFVMLRASVERDVKAATLGVKLSAHYGA